MASVLLTLFVLAPAFIWGWGNGTLLGFVAVVVYAAAIGAWHLVADARYSRVETRSGLVTATVMALFGVLPAYLAGRVLAWFVPF